MKCKLLVVLVLLSLQGNAQISEEGYPWSFGLSGNTIIVNEIIITKPLGSDIMQDTNNNLKPALAGEIIYKEVDLASAGSWLFLEDDRSICLLHIKSKGAKAIGLYFNTFLLPDNSALYIYNKTKTEILGAFTSRNNGSEGKFSIEPMPGEELIVEYNQYGNSKTNVNVLLEGIGYLTNYPVSAKGFGGSGPCEVNINCPEGALWQSQKKGVARILLRSNSSLYWCTGSLVNNTRLDNTPYILTANHCGKYSSASDYEQWIFYFNYESPTCENPENEPTSNSISGSSLIAKSIDNESFGSDFKLLLLEEEVPVDYEPYFNGWSRDANPAGFGVGIHHPQGDIKKISTYMNPLVSVRYESTSPDPNGLYWKVVWSETETNHGVTEGGSSGSPVFNQDGLIVGALTGGSASCQNLTGPDYYGKFSFSWMDNGVFDSLQLKPWLDPVNSGVTSLNGMWTNGGQLTAGFNSSSDTVEIGGSVLFFDASTGNPDSWKWLFEGGSPATSTANNPSVTYNSFGSFNVELIVSKDNSSDTLLKKDKISVRPIVSANPVSGFIDLFLGNPVSGEVMVYMFNTVGKQVIDRRYEVFNNHLLVDISMLNSCFYILGVEKEGFISFLKVLVV